MLDSLKKDADCATTENTIELFVEKKKDSCCPSAAGAVYKSSVAQR